MKKFFKFGKGRKESAEASGKTGGSVSRHGSVSSLVQSSGGYEVRDKDMSKLHRAAWTGDMSKLTQLIKSSRGTVADKENRPVVLRYSCESYMTATCTVRIIEQTCKVIFSVKIHRK